MIDISVIIVNWNVRELLRRCLASVIESCKKDAGFQTEIIVIDNASSDDSVGTVEQEFPQVRLVRNACNLGFTSANNQGIRLSSGRYLLLLNPDTEVRDSAISVQGQYLDSNPAVAVVGPQLMNADGSVQSSRRRFPTVITAFIESTVLQRYLGGLPVIRRYYFEDKPDNFVQEVDWLVGACLMVRREAIEQVGSLDEDFFMYFEELDLCYRLKKARWKIVYLPEAQVVHYYGQSSEKDLPHRHIYFNDSKCKFFRKHYGPATAIMLRWFLLGTYIFQIVEEGLKWLLGRKRLLRRNRIDLLMRVVRSGLRG